MNKEEVDLEKSATLTEVKNKKRFSISLDCNLSRFKIKCPDRYYRYKVSLKRAN